MKLIRPFAMSQAALLSSNVPETPPAAYSSGTTYASAALVSVTSGDHLDVYESRAGGNLNHTPASSPTWWKRVASTYAVWSNATSYAVGAKVISTTTNHAYEVLTAGSGHDPATDGGTNWLDIGADNRWAMFDGAVQSQTTRLDQIRVQVQITGRLNSIALLNLEGASVTVKMTDGVDGVVYNHTEALVSSSGITDWYAYFFEPVSRRTDIVLTDLPSYGNVTLEIIVDAPGGTAAIGAAIPGLSREIGSTMMGARVGITDYSRKTTDDFGNTMVVKRPFSKRTTLSVLVDNGLVDELQNLLASYRAEPTVYIGDETYASTIVYGFYKSFEIEIAYPSHSLCSFDLEGLI